MLVTDNLFRGNKLQHELSDQNHLRETITTEHVLFADNSYFAL